MSDGEEGRVERLGICQAIMVEAARMLGFDGRDIAAAGLFTAASAFVISPEKTVDDFAAAAKDIYLLTEEILRERKEREAADPAGLAEREPQGGVS